MPCFSENIPEEAQAKRTRRQSWDKTHSENIYVELLTYFLSLFWKSLSARLACLPFININTENLTPDLKIISSWIMTSTAQIPPASCALTTATSFCYNLTRTTINASESAATLSGRLDVVSRGHRTVNLPFRIESARTASCTTVLCIISARQSLRSSPVRSSLSASIKPRNREIARERRKVQSTSAHLQSVSIESFIIVQFHHYHAR